jgi:hypothetical protein
MHEMSLSRRNVRNRFSSPAIRSLLRLAAHWKLRDEHSRALLQGMSRQFLWAEESIRGITGIHDVAQVVFVRKRLVEIQYVQTTITDDHRQEFSEIHDTIRRIEAAEFPPHSGIRFPQNPCSTCPYQGLCLDKPQLVDARLIRRPGAQDFGVFDELTY